VEAALKELQATVAAENPETGAGNPQALQSACAALDDATKPLADLLMDRAMEALLRKRGTIQ